MQKPINNKTLVWVVGSLVIVNILVLAMLLHTKKSGFKFDHDVAHDFDREHSATGSFLHQELVLSETQKHHLEQIRHEYFNWHRKHVGKIHQLREKVNLEAMENEPDLTKIRALSDSLGKIMAEGEFARFHHFIQVKDICTPEQLDKLEHLLDDALHLTAPHIDVDEDQEHETNENR